MSLVFFARRNELHVPRTCRLTFNAIAFHSNARCRLPRSVHRMRTHSAFRLCSARLLLFPPRSDHTINFRSIFECFSSSFKCAFHWDYCQLSYWKLNAVIENFVDWKITLDTGYGIRCACASASAAHMHRHTRWCGRCSSIASIVVWLCHCCIISTAEHKTQKQQRQWIKYVWWKRELNILTAQCKAFSIYMQFKICPMHVRFS